MVSANFGVVSAVNQAVSGNLDAVSAYHKKVIAVFQVKTAKLLKNTAICHTKMAIYGAVRIESYHRFTDLF